MDDNKQFKIPINESNKMIDNGWSYLIVTRKNLKLE